MVLQDTADLVAQDLGGNGFAQECARSQPEEVAGGVFGCVAGPEDARKARCLGADGREDFHARGAGHVHVQERDVELGAPDDGQGLLARFRFEYFQAKLAQELGGADANGGVVISDQDAAVDGHGRVARSRAGRGKPRAASGADRGESASAWWGRTCSLGPGPA